MQSRNNFHVNQTDLHEVSSRLTFLPTFFSSESITGLPGWYLKKKDLSEMLQEQAEWYQGKTDPYETTIFCIVNSEHYQTSKMEFSAKIIGGYFYKFLENIKYAFKKSEVASKRKVLP